MDEKLSARLLAIHYGDTIEWSDGEGVVEGWRSAYWAASWHTLVLVAPPEDRPGRPREVPLAWVTARHREGKPTINFE
jgi:hypothetical protein